jgi:SAM-dependent methyltransferase
LRKTPPRITRWWVRLYLNFEKELIMAPYLGNFWEETYSENFVPETPSAFAEFVLENFQKSEWVIEFGCGNGRDSFWFSQKGLKIYASDKSKIGIEKCRIKTQGNESLSFSAVHYANVSEIEEWIDGFPDKYEKAFVYLRFLLHDVDETTQIKILDAVDRLSEYGVAGIALEFRTTEDEDRPKLNRPHYRRFIDVQDFERDLKKRGLQIRYKTAGLGLAVHLTEDAYVARYILGS